MALSPSSLPSAHLLPRKSRPESHAMGCDEQRKRAEICTPRGAYERGIGGSLVGRHSLLLPMDGVTVWCLSKRGSNSSLQSWGAIQRTGIHSHSPCDAATAAVSNSPLTLDKSHSSHRGREPEHLLPSSHIFLFWGLVSLILPSEGLNRLHVLSRLHTSAAPFFKALPSSRLEAQQSSPAAAS